MAQCLIHRTGSMFKAFISVTGTPDSTAVATLGNKSFTGIINSAGLGTIVVKKKGTYTVTSDASGSQTKQVAVIEMNQTYSVNISGAFTLTLNNTYSTVSVSRTSSPYGGGVSTSLPSGATIYYGDVLSISGSANDGFEGLKLTVNGATKNGSIYVVNTDTTVTTVATPIVYALSITQDTGTKVTVERITVGAPGEAAGATTKTLVSGDSIYKNDVLKISTSASGDAYKTPSLDVNGSSFTTGNTHTVTGKVNVSSSTTVKSFTLTITSASQNTLTVSRSTSPYAGAAKGNLTTLSTIYYGDTLSISQSLTQNYTGNYSVVHNGKTVFDKVTESNSLTVVGNVTASSTATAQELTITIQSFQTTSRVLFTFKVTPGKTTWANMVGSGKWYPSNITERYLPTWAENSRFCSYLYFTNDTKNGRIVMHWESVSHKETSNDSKYGAWIYRTKDRNNPVSNASIVTGGVYYAPFDEED